MILIHIGTRLHPPKRELEKKCRARTLFVTWANKTNFSSTHKNPLQEILKYIYLYKADDKKDLQLGHWSSFIYLSLEYISDWSSKLSSDTYRSRRLRFIFGRVIDIRAYSNRVWYDMDYLSSIFFCEWHFVSFPQHLHFSNTNPSLIVIFYWDASWIIIAHMGSQLIQRHWYIWEEKRDKLYRSFIYFIFSSCLNKINYYIKC